MANTSLLSLPDELLALVIRQVALRDKVQLLLLSLTCRRLGLLVQTQLFKDISVDSVYRVCSLSNTLARRPNLRRNMARLHIRFKKTYDGGSDGSDVENDSLYGDSEHPHPPRNVHATLYECGIAGLLLSSSLPALVHLSLNAFPPPLLRHLLREVQSKGTLPCLSSIQLAGAPSQYDTAARAPPDLLSLISSIPTLRHLDLHFFDLELPTSTDDETILSGLQTLKLWPVRYAYNHTAVPLVDFVPNLRVLEMKGTWSASVLRHFLQTAPRNLLTLSVPRSDPDCFHNLERHLGRFTALEEVRLRVPIDLATILPQLLAAPIQKLVIGSHEIKVSDSVLDGLVRGMHDLRHLELDHILIPIPPDELETCIMDSLVLFRGEPRTAADRARAECQPRWTGGATAEGHARILRSPAASGILIEGTITASLGWEQAFDELFERCLVEYAFERNNPQALTAYFGPQRAREAIRQYRSGFLDLLVDDEEVRPRRRSSRRGKEAQR